MAVNTRDRRASALHYQHPSVYTYPLADGMIVSDTDRHHIAKAYRGISAMATQDTRGHVVASCSARYDLLLTVTRQDD